MTTATAEAVITAPSTQIAFDGVSITNLYQNLPGPTIPTGFFKASGGQLVIEVAASGSTPNTNTLAGLSFELNGTVIGNTTVFSNPPGQHMSFTPAVFQAAGLVGQNTMVVRPLSGTIFDINDRLNVTVTEYLPASR